jgi:hypothetical protein
MKITGIITPICWSFTLWSVIFYTVVLISGTKPLLYRQIGWLLGISVGIGGLWISKNDTFILYLAQRSNLTPRVVRAFYIWFHLAWLLFCLAKIHEFQSFSSPVLTMAGVIFFVDFYFIVVGIPRVYQMYQNVPVIPLGLLSLAYLAYLLYLSSLRSSRSLP